jgi:hypothetical protein
VTSARRFVAALATVCVTAVLLTGTASAAEKVPVSEWMNGVCETLSGWRDDVQQQADDFQDSLSSDSSVPEVKDQFVQFLDDVVATTEAMLSDLRDLGVPDVTQGSGIATTMRNGLRKIQTGLEDAHTRAENLPTGDRASFRREVNSIGTALNKSSSAAGDVFDAAKKKYDTKQLDAAEKRSAACKELS